MLVIDQLDALAGYVDLRTARLSILLNLVRKVGAQNNVHVVLSSRTFEFQHDTRLKSVRGRKYYASTSGLERDNFGPRGARRECRRVARRRACRHAFAAGAFHLPIVK